MFPYSYSVDIKAKGKSRFAFCKFKPLDIEFPKSVESTIFEGLEKVFITAHCGETNKISVSCRILNVTIETQTEWLTDVKELELYEVPVATKVFYLEVPVDYELEWKAIFEHEEIIEWTGPNYYDEIIYN